MTIFNIETSLDPNDVCDTRDLIQNATDMAVNVIESLTDAMHEAGFEDFELDISEEDYTELSAILSSCADNGECSEYGLDEDAFSDWICSNGDDMRDFIAFVDFLGELSNNAADFEYGETVIADNYTDEYCEQFCTNVGYISSDIPSWIRIDWTATWEEMRMDYSSADFNGDTYWIR